MSVRIGDGKWNEMRCEERMWNVWNAGVWVPTFNVDVLAEARVPCYKCGEHVTTESFNSAIFPPNFSLKV
jgi:hypothetical protein